MKSFRALLISLLSIICISINAQVFLGGGIRFNTANSEHSGSLSTEKTSNYSLGLSPSAGKFLSDKLTLGLALDFSLSGNKREDNTETISKSSGIGISPFLRYYALKWNKFSVYGQGNIGIRFSRSSVKIAGNTINEPKNTSAYLSIYPGLSYDISDKLSLETSLNILSFGYNYTITKDGSSQEKVSSFNFGAGLGNIVSVGAITIGAIFKF